MMLTSTGKSRREQREELLSAVAAEPAAAVEPARPVMMTEGERSLAQLQETQRIAADTERLGMSILGQLSDQRGQLESSIEQRAEMHESLSISSRLIRQMHRRAVWMKVALCLILLFLVVGVIVIVWLKWLQPQHHDDHHDPHRRHLQTTDASPSAPSTLLPPSPPVAFTIVDPSRPLGAGIVILIVLGSLSVIGMLWAYPRGLVTRFLTFLAITIVYGATALVLLLMPRHSAEPDPDSGKITDVGVTWRYVLISTASFFCLVALGAIAALDLTAVDQAPKVTEHEPVEAYRLKT